MLYALADTGMAGALTSALSDGQRCVTIELKIVYFRPASGGRLVCETELVHRGRRTAALESTVTANGKTLARAYGTFMIAGAEAGSP